MLWHPFLLLFRKRLIATAILSLVVAILVAVLGGDVRSHLVGINFFLCIPIGVYLGWTSAKNRAAETRFLFTRPISRLAVLLRPLIVASFAVAIFPLATFLLLLGWLCLLHTARSQLVGLYPSPLQVLATTHFASFYPVVVSAGIIVYGLMASQRWLTLSPKWLRSLINFSALFFLLPVVFLGIRAGFGAIADVWLFVFAAEMLYCCWRILRGIDELPEPGHSSAAADLEEKIRALRAAREARINIADH